MTASPALHFRAEPALARGMCQRGKLCRGMCHKDLFPSPLFLGKRSTFGREAPSLAPGKLGLAQDTSISVGEWWLCWLGDILPKASRFFGLLLRTGNMLEMVCTFLQWGCTTPCLLTAVTAGSGGVRMGGPQGPPKLSPGPLYQDSGTFRNCTFSLK